MKTVPRLVRLKLDDCMQKFRPKCQSYIFPYVEAVSAFSLQVYWTICSPHAALYAKHPIERSQPWSPQPYNASTTIHQKAVRHFLDVAHDLSASKQPSSRGRFYLGLTFRRHENHASFPDVATMLKIDRLWPSIKEEVRSLILRKDRTQVAGYVQPKRRGRHYSKS